MRRPGQAVIYLFTLSPLSALACPLCHTTTAEEVRQNLIKTTFDGLTIPALLLPFVALAVVVYIIQTDWTGLFQKENKISN